MNVIRLNYRMPIHANDNVAPGLPDGNVHPGGHDPLGILHDFNLYVLVFSQPCYQITGPVGGHAIGNQHLHPFVRIVLCEDPTQAALNESSFVPNGHYHGNKWNSIAIHLSRLASGKLTGMNYWISLSFLAGGNDQRTGGKDMSFKKLPQGLLRKELNAIAGPGRSFHPRHLFVYVTKTRQV
jgi:hypothetical protein